MIVAIDDRWEDILTNIQSEGKKVMTPERMDEVLITSGVGVDDHRKANQMLYVTLLAYTEDDVLAVVKSGQADGSMEAFRLISTKGRNVTHRHITDMHTY